VRVKTSLTTKISYVSPNWVGSMLKKLSIALMRRAGFVAGVEFPYISASQVGREPGRTSAGIHSFGLQRKFGSGMPASKLQFSRTGLHSQPGGQPHLRHKSQHR
jgi:hypothetical protein